MTMRFDASDLFDFAGDCSRVATSVPELLNDAAVSLGNAVQGRAQLNAQRRHTKGTGTMANTIATVPKTVSATAAIVEVIAPAVSGKGFPYPIVVDAGRNAIVMPKGRYMKFEGRDGPVFLKRLPAYSGSRFFSDAETDTRKSGDLDGVADLFAEDVFALLRN